MKIPPKEVPCSSCGGKGRIRNPGRVAYDLRMLRLGSRLLQGDISAFLGRARSWVSGVEAGDIEIKPYLETAWRKACK